MRTTKSLVILRVEIFNCGYITMADRKRRKLEKLAGGEMFGNNVFDHDELEHLSHMHFVTINLCLIVNI